MRKKSEGMGRGGVAKVEDESWLSWHREAEIVGLSSSELCLDLELDWER